MLMLRNRFLVVGSEETNYNNKSPFVVIDTTNGNKYKCAFEGDEVIYGNTQGTQRQITKVYAMGVAYATDVEILTKQELKQVIDNLTKDKDDTNYHAVVEHVISSGATHATEKVKNSKGELIARTLTLAEQIDQGCARVVSVYVAYFGDINNKEMLYTNASKYACKILSDTTCVNFVKVGYLKDIK